MKSPSRAVATALLKWPHHLSDVALFGNKSATPGSAEGGEAVMTPRVARVQDMPFPRCRGHVVRSQLYAICNLRLSLSSAGESFKRQLRLAG